MADMSGVNLASIDLNLLHVVATVLEERSATRAAARLHVTQSAVSNALRRARAIFGDPLVVREPHGLSATPRAASLAPALRAWLEEAQRLVRGEERFEPRTSTRTFAIACSDSVSTMLLGPLLSILRERAPNARLRLMTLDRLLAQDALARGEADLLVGIPPVLPPGHDAELLFRDPLVCLVRADGAPSGRALSLAAYTSMPHVELALFGARDDRVDQALARREKTREVVVTVPHFSSVPLAVLETRGVATVARRLAAVFATWMPLAIKVPPVALEPIEIRQVWHRRTEDDAAVVFLRRAVMEAARANPSRAGARRAQSSGRGRRARSAPGV